VVFPDHHSPSRGGVDGPAAGEADHSPCELGRWDPGSVWSRDVAVIPGYGVGDTDPSGGRHVAPQGNVPGPDLMGDVPPGEVRHRNDVLEANRGL
jgi:hypothetical protein